MVVVIGIKGRRDWCDDGVVVLLNVLIKYNARCVSMTTVPERVLGVQVPCNDVPVATIGEGLDVINDEGLAGWLVDRRDAYVFIAKGYFYRCRIDGGIDVHLAVDNSTVDEHCRATVRRQMWTSGIVCAISKIIWNFEFVVRVKFCLTK
jgi:hypothetical protein